LSLRMLQSDRNDNTNRGDFNNDLILKVYIC
jgi:hypothetical protein